MHVEAKSQLFGVALLPEVDHGVPELPATPLYAADAPCEVVLAETVRLGDVVSHVLSPALLTDLKKGVAVQLSEGGRVDPALPMQPVYVLTDDALKQASILELDKREVGLGWPSSPH